MNKVFLILISCLLLISCEDKDLITIETEFGDMKVRLLDSTPKHKENFKKLVSQGFYNDLLFHRVIKGFMIQGGDPDSKIATMDQSLGGGSPGYNIPAEIGVPHFKGMLSAARLGDNLNPHKESSGSQFFIVHGAAVTDQEMDASEKVKNFKYTPAQREKYKNIGGSPMLDGDYSVFGEVVKGLDVLDKLMEVKTDARDRPLQNLKMKIK